jgi:hypothetical protein
LLPRVLESITIPFRSDVAAPLALGEEARPAPRAARGDD